MQAGVPGKPLAIRRKHPGLGGLVLSVQIEKIGEMVIVIISTIKLRAGVEGSSPDVHETQGMGAFLFLQRGLKPPRFGSRILLISCGILLPVTSRKIRSIGVSRFDFRGIVSSRSGAVRSYFRWREKRNRGVGHHMQVIHHPRSHLHQAMPMPQQLPQIPIGGVGNPDPRKAILYHQSQQ
jgi:hypothetical protein